MGEGAVSCECKSSGSEPVLWLAVLYSLPKKGFSLCIISFSFLLTSFVIFCFYREKAESFTGKIC